MLQSLHNHTWRCKHASGTEEEYCRRAIEGGIRELGFSDHAPFPAAYVLERPIVHGVRMELSQLSDYVSQLTDLRDRLADKLKIYIGLELEYLPGLHRELMDLYRSFQLDYLILGQHFLRDGTAFMLRPTEDRELLKEYVDTVLEGAATGDFLLAAHPDLINFRGPEEIYLQEMERLARGLRERGVPPEINLHGLAEGRNYPDERFWRMVGALGCPTVIGTDAHAPEEVWEPEVYGRALDLAKRCGVTLLESLL